MRMVADLIVRTLKARTDEGEIAAVRSEVARSAPPSRRIPISWPSACPTSAGTAWSW